MMDDYLVMYIEKDIFKSIRQQFQNMDTRQRQLNKLTLAATK
jgi:hypothetical protein